MDAEKKALRLNPFLWTSFESLCNKGEFVHPDKVFDIDNLDNFSHCQGVNPLVNLVNSNQESCEDAVEMPDLAPAPVKILQTPQLQVQSTPQHMPGTPHQPPVFTPLQPPIQTLTPGNLPSILLNDSSLALSTPKTNAETPLLHWNNASTPMSGMGAQISGISFLNCSTDSDISRTASGIMPPPLR